MRNGIDRREETALSWASMATTETGATCTGDTAIDCRNAKRIMIQIDQSATTHNGANTDLNIFTRSEGTTTYDTVAFAEWTSAPSAAVESFTVAPAGFAYMKLQADNNDTSNKAAPKVIVQIIA